MISHLDMIARIAAGAACGGIIGFERDIHGRPVGLRTHLIVAMAAATFMVVSNQFLFFQDYAGIEHLEVDASRIAASVVSGIGFLAGGVILKTGFSIQGVTTAAGLWLVTAIGLACGGSMYIEAGAVTFMGLVALTILRVFEDKNDAVTRRHISLVMQDGDVSRQKVNDTFAALNAHIVNFDYERKTAEHKVAVHFEVSIPVSVSVNELIEKLEIISEIEQVHIKTRGA